MKGGVSEERGGIELRASLIELTKEGDDWTGRHFGRWMNVKACLIVRVRGRRDVRCSDGEDEA